MNYHARMMNIQFPKYATTPMTYETGHRDARHAAAEIANEADAEIKRLQTQLDQITYLLRANPNAYAYDILETFEVERVTE
jgi:REP element-mobilizing transposase RayT